MTAQIEISSSPRVDNTAGYDEAVLDLIALEMAAPDFDEADIAEACRHTGRIRSNARPARSRQSHRSRACSIPQPSLGASLIASGIASWRDASTADPLAAVRRMSQAEKIAFFS